MSNQNHVYIGNSRKYYINVFKNKNQFINIDFYETSRFLHKITNNCNQFRIFAMTHLIRRLSYYWKKRRKNLKSS